MFRLRQRRGWGHAVLAAAVLAIGATGCTRTKYRLQADRDAYAAIAERNNNPAWATRDYNIELDPRSRYYDPYDQDHPPMPMDDPAAHDYMRCVSGRRGWSHWGDNGFRPDFENPGWRQDLVQYVELTEDGEIRLDIASALALAYMHSPNHQRQLETLYLSSLDVVEERFALDTQLFGGYGVDYRHQGRLLGESNELTVGRAPAGSVFRLDRQLASAGQLLVGFANSFVYEFTGANAGISSSLVNLTFVQPLLRGAGRDVGLERLTQSERTLLSNLRAYAQFRQGFFTQVAIGELGVVGPARFGTGTALLSFSGRGGVDGYFGLLRQRQRIQNIKDNLNLLLRTLAQLEVRLQFGSIDLIQVDLFRQQVESERTNLLRSENDYQLALDNYKTDVLGLPPDVEIELDATLIEPFQFISIEANQLLDQIVGLQTAMGTLPVGPEGELAPDIDDALIQQFLEATAEILPPTKDRLAAVPTDLGRMEAAAATREAPMSPSDRKAFQEERQRMHRKYEDLLAEFETLPEILTNLSESFRPENRAHTVNELITYLRRVRRILERSTLIQAGARLESITVDPVPAEDERAAYAIALANRLDFMNGRAALVDTWRSIQVNADALQSVLTFTADADMRTARDNPVSFRAPASTARVGLEFDAPLTRLIERNDYREALINYQRDRRTLVQSHDALFKGVRALRRQLLLLKSDLEIRRRAVTIAIRQVDFTQTQLDAPVRPALPGQRPPQFGSTTSQNLIASSSSLRDTQSGFLEVWLDYYATRMRLMREMGTMALGEDGLWLDPVSESNENTPPALDVERMLVPEDLPPPIPQAWIDLLRMFPNHPQMPPQPNGVIRDPLTTATSAQGDVR